MLTFTKSRNVAGSTEILQLMRASAGGGYEPYVDGFFGDESLLCETWPGEDRSAVAELPAAWHDAEAGKVAIAFPLATIDSLAPGTYSASLHLADRSAHLAAFLVEIVDGPGESIARPKYGSLKDLRNELPWIDTLHDPQSDQSGFADALADARDWADVIILSHVRTTGRYDPRRFGGLGTGNEEIREALAADKLMLDTPNGRKIVKACVYKSLAQILRRCVGSENVPTDLLQLSRYYEAKADATIITCLAEIDADDDGFPEHLVNLGVTATR